MVNELIPKELGWTYSDDLSLLPLKRKEVPWAPGKGPVSLVVPGFARTMLNDLWLAATAPGRTVAGEFSAEELPGVAARAGGALTWGPGLVASRARNELGAGWGWPAKAAAKDVVENPKLANVTGELNMLNDDALEQFSKKGYGVTFHNGNYNIFSLKGGGAVSPSELPFDLQNLHSKLTQKHQQFNALLAKEEASLVEETPLEKFNAVYSDANYELGKLHFGVGIDAGSGKFNLIDKVTGKQFEPVAGGIAEPILETLNKAKEKYVSSPAPAGFGASGSTIEQAAKTLGYNPLPSKFGAPGNSIGQDAQMLGYKKKPLVIAAPPKNDVFDPSAPLSAEQRAENFNTFFAGSKLVDEVGNPMIMYHASPANAIEAFDPKVISKKSGGSRDFTSLTSDPNFANHWKSEGEGTTHYPVFVSAKNPGDFRDPDHVYKAAAWTTREELKNWKHLSDKQLNSWLAEPKNKMKYDDMLGEKRAAAASGIWTFWENPKMWKQMGWDGAFMLESAGKIDKNNPVNFAAPDPGQIKSVFNKGFWDRNDPRILYSGAGGLPLNVEPIDHDPFAMEEVAGDPFEEEKKK